MGVLKNDVGRPSNKTIRTRFILKLIGLILVVGIAFFIGYKLSGEKEEVKEHTEQNKVKENAEEENKYKKFKFINQTSYQASERINEVYSILHLELVDGDVIGYIEETKEEIKSIGINSKVKYIDGYCRYDFDACSETIIALSENKELYLGNYDDSSKTIKFEFVSSNVKEILLTGMVASFDSGNDGGIENKIYALTDKDELLEVKFDEKNFKFYISKDKYDDAYLYVGDYHQGYTVYNSIIRLRDRSFGFYHNQTEKEFVPVKYNNKVVNVKNLFVGIKFDYGNSENSEHYVYIIDQNNNLLTNKEKLTGMSIKENCAKCYELKRVSESLVKEYETITYKDEYETEKTKLKVLFEDGSEITFDYDFSSEELY